MTLSERAQDADCLPAQLLDLFLFGGGAFRKVEKFSDVIEDGFGVAWGEGARCFSEATDDGRVTHAVAHGLQAGKRIAFDLEVE